ncbi:MAG: hypothetical protein EBR01_01870 [Proteobacteria bacterium]|nr:hypothetical protein [Pseudomonadota bacterium]
MSRFVLGVLIVLNFFGKSWAVDFPVSYPNPYVDLYLQRLHESESDLKKSEAILQLELVKMQIAKRTFEKKAITFEEYQEHEASVKVAEADVNQKHASIGAAEALYKLAISRTEAGQDMPICTN